MEERSEKSVRKERDFSSFVVEMTAARKSAQDGITSGDAVR